MRQQRSARKQALKQQQELLTNEVENSREAATTFKDCSEHLITNKEVKEGKQDSLSQHSEEISLNKGTVTEPHQVFGHDTGNSTMLYQRNDSFEQPDTSNSPLGVHCLATQEKVASPKRETMRLRRLRYRKRKKEKEFWYKIGIIE